MCPMLPPARLLVQHRPYGSLDSPYRVFFSDLGRGGHNLVPPRIYLQVEAEEGVQTMTDTYCADDPPGASRRPALTARGTACESCGRRHAVLTLTYGGAAPFRLCQSCVAPSLDLVAQPVTAVPPPTLQAAVPEGVW